MATKTSKAPAGRKSRTAQSGAASTAAKKTTQKADTRGRAAGTSTGTGTITQAMPDAAQFAKFAKMMTPEQAFDLYKANAKMALDIINAAVESTAKMRRLQFEGEEQAR